MNIKRRKFISKSLLLVSSATFAGYSLSKNRMLTPKKEIHTANKTISATYSNTRHNRQFYASARF